MPNSNNNDDQFALHRFLAAQETVYRAALSELQSGHKRSHWMWFVFPQIDGLGSSPTAKRYAIRSLAEAKAYLDHPVLGGRLLECTEAVLNNRGLSAAEMFGYPDTLKFRSSLTLFERVAPPNSLFSRALDSFFDGERDARTLELIESG